MRKIVPALALATALALPSLAAAQASGSVQATANVLTPLSVDGAQPLEFGDVLPGISYTINPGTGSSGLFEISGATGAGVLLNFTLPSELSGPGDPIAISFGGASALVDNGSTSTSFDPSTSDYLSAMNGSGNLDVYIGGTITPAQSQAQGAYSATISLQVVYSGS
jgi:hypothetical protein